MIIENVALFRSIASLGTLSAAARQLGVPVMTVSRRLATLESDVGVRLFHRTTRSVSLTPEGEAFLPYAISMLETHDAALAAMAAGGSGLQGVLKMTAPNLIGRSIIVPALTHLMADNPLLKVDLTLTDGIVDLAGTGLDLAIRVSPLNSSELVATRLAPNPRVLCAAPDYIKRFGKPASVADLLGHSCLTLHGIPSWPFRIGEEIRWTRVKGPFTANSIEAVRAACLDGIGLAVMTYWDVKDCLQQGSLERIEMKDAQLPELGIWGVYPTRRQIPHRTRAVMDFIKARMARPEA
jgi:DNA-binding transcriptional LysR family regulator